MNILLLLLAAYGICFGLQNKLPFLWGRHALLDHFLGCTYCVGFHAGWITWILQEWARDDLSLISWASIGEILAWSFASGAFCYVVDGWMERQESPPA